MKRDVWYRWRLEKSFGRPQIADTSFSLMPTYQEPSALHSELLDFSFHSCPFFLRESVSSKR